MFTCVILLCALWTAADAAVLGAYVFHRHGDRTPKLLAPTNLTDLGYRQVYESGQYFRSRFLDTSSSHFISGISPDLYNQEQLFISAPLDTVLQNSATGFLQAFYPPVPSTQTLRNSSTVSAPMEGYQLIPVAIVESGGGSENSGWLQDSTECANAESSSNEYYYSDKYIELYDSTKSFYQMLEPVISATVHSSTANFKNAYTIFDLINVAEIHNDTIPSSSILTDDVLFQLRTLADTHEYDLAYNESSMIRAVAGSQLSGEIMSFFDDLIDSGAPGQLSIQFGAYATFFSFFGLADLPSVSSDFFGLPDYASAAVWELYTDEDDFEGLPDKSDMKVRFYFRNGTNNGLEPTPFAPFGDSEMSLSYDDFSSRMRAFSIETTHEWCTACGNTTGVCAPFSASSAAGSASSSNGNSGAMSNAVAGVIGAMVTLATILLVELVIMFAAGLRLVRKQRLLRARNDANGENGTKN